MPTNGRRRADLLCDTSVAMIGIAGGAVYDALVAVAASEAEVPLLSLDRRAADTYRILGVECTLIG